MWCVPYVENGLQIVYFLFFFSDLQIVAMAVIIFGFWNVPVVRNLINPLKLFTIGWHELCHISAVCALWRLFCFCVY